MRPLVLMLVLPLAVPGMAQIKGSNVMQATVHQRAQVLLIRLHDYNLAQIHMGQRAEREGTTAKVRKLGTLIARYHKLADKKVRQIAARNSLGLNGPLPPGTPAAVPIPPGAPLPPLSQIHGASFDGAFLARVVRQDELTLNELLRVEMFVRVSRFKDLIHDMMPVVKQEQQLAVSLGNTRA